MSTYLTQIAKKCRLRYGLRFSLVIVALLCVVLAWIGKERRQSRREAEIAEAYRAMGAEVGLCGPYDPLEVYSNDGRPVTEPVWWQRLARWVLGERIIWLGLPEVSVDDFQPIAELTNLQWFYSSKSPINDLGPLTGMRRLRCLSVAGPQMLNAEAIGTLEGLESLVLAGPEVESLEYLANLTKLKGLSLQGAKIHDLTPLQGLTELTQLGLQFTQVEQVTPLRGLHKLKTLVLYGNPITREQVELLREAMPDCEIR